MCQSVCENCKHLCSSPMVVRGVMDCDPPEWWCENESENFMTDDGCCNYEEAKYE